MNAQGTILLIDPERTFAPVFARALEEAGHQVIETRTVESACLAAERRVPNVVFKPALNLGGRGLMERLQRMSADILFIFVQKNADVRSAMEAARRGAFDCLPLPCSGERVVESVRQALDYQRSKALDPRLLARLGDPAQPDLLAGKSPAIRKVKRMVTRVAATDVTVLIQGESGTGKELVARMLHELSLRSAGPFVAVNSAALTDSLIESELFGHVKGAFTGAVADKPGRFALASQGTLFLDEIGDLSPLGQADLLRVLEDGMYRPVGSRTMVQADARIIAATHRNLEEACARGTFREDLLYRLNVITLELPPLRERLEDLELLANQFLIHFCAKHRVPLKRLTEAAVLQLQSFSWPGNVRQLRNMIERIVLLEPSSEIGPEHLPDYLRGSPTISERIPLEKMTLAEAEHEIIRRVLIRCKGNKTQAARELGIGRRTLYDKLRHFPYAT